MTKLSSTQVMAKNGGGKGVEKRKSGKGANKGGREKGAPDEGSYLQSSGAIQWGPGQSLPHCEHEWTPAQQLPGEIQTIGSCCS